MHEEQIIGIIAHDKNYGMGFENGLPWHIPEDLAHFKRNTLGRVCIMGRKTWESLPKKSLPGREIWVLSDTVREEIPNVKFFDEKSLKIAILSSPHLTFAICGGMMVFSLFSKMIPKWVITSVDGEYKCDTYFDPTLLEGYDMSPDVGVLNKQVHVRTYTRA